MKTNPVFLFISSIILLCMSATSCNHNNNRHWPLPEKELKDLDLAISSATKYKKLSSQYTDSIRSIIVNGSTPDSIRLDLCQTLSEYYRPRQADSALLYARKAMHYAKKSGVPEEILQSRLQEIDALSASGLFSAAVLAYDSISTSDASKNLKISYWRVGRHLYSNICNYLGEEIDPSFEYYKDKLYECIDSLIRFENANISQRNFLVNERLIRLGKVTEARKGLDSLLNKCHKGENIYGMVAFQIAQTYQQKDQTRYAAYLAMAAESDILGAICDGYALPMLSAWMYDQGNLDKAFNYINFALNEAYEGNARMRIVNISQWVPSIDEAYRHDLNETKNEFATLTIIITLALIGLICALAYLSSELRKKRKYHQKMAQVSKMKSHYIRDFIRLCSVYSEKYESLSKTVVRKLTAGQSQDLLKLLKYGKTSEAENEEFYRTIDNVFFSIYPDFIEKINNLLKPEERFEVNPESKTLNPELRIYGFVILGVTESAKIARILNYSSNTVYTYRNRMRKRAINHETFDKDVISIDLDDNKESENLINS